MAAATTSKLSSKSHGGSETFAILAAKHLLWLFSWGCVAFYAMVWIIMPTKHGEKFYDKVYHKFEFNKQWGGPGKSLNPSLHACLELNESLFLECF